MESNKIKELEQYLDTIDNLSDTGWFSDDTISDYTFYHKEWSLRDFILQGREYIRQYLMEEKGMKDAI